MAEMERRYKPAEILRSYKVMLRSPLEGAPLLVEGRLSLNRHREYSGYYYGDLTDTEGESITVKIPSSIARSLIDGQIYVFRGTLDTRTSTKAIEVELTVSSVLEERPPRSEEEFRALVSRVSRRDVLRELERKLQQGKPPTIIVLYGLGSIVDRDVQAALGEALRYFDLRAKYVNLSSTEALIAALREADREGADAIAVVRGGGEGLHSLNRLEFLKCCQTLQTPLICAVGHAREEVLLRAVADQAFISPTQFGERLREMALQVTHWRSREEALQQKERLLSEKERELIQRERRLERAQKLRPVWTFLIPILVAILLAFVGFLLFLRRHPL